MNSMEEAIFAVENAWPGITQDAEEVSASELHYQAMIYNRLRIDGGIPLKQLGMNVKMLIKEPVSLFFQEEAEKTKSMRSVYSPYKGIQPTPDIVIFNHSIDIDWRRSNSDTTMVNMLSMIEVKVSEFTENRLTASDIIKDIHKLAAHREEVESLGATVLPIMMVIDAAHDESNKMLSTSIDEYQNVAYQNRIKVFHHSSSYE